MKSTQNLMTTKKTTTSRVKAGGPKPCGPLSGVKPQPAAITSSCVRPNRIRDVRFRIAKTVDVNTPSKLKGVDILRREFSLNDKLISFYKKKVCRYLDGVLGNSGEILDFRRREPDKIFRYFQKTTYLMKIYHKSREECVKAQRDAIRNTTVKVGSKLFKWFSRPWERRGLLKNICTANIDSRAQISHLRGGVENTPSKLSVFVTNKYEGYIGLLTYGVRYHSFTLSEVDKGGLLKSSKRN